MSIKTDAELIRDETTTGANTAARVGGNLVDIADDLVAKQTLIDANTAKTGITAQQATDITTNNAKNTYPSADASKLSGIEANATADQTGAEIKALYEAEANTNAFTDAEKTLLGNQSGTNTGDQDISGIATNASAISGKQATLVSGTNIKTINGSTVLGSGDLTVSAGDIEGTAVKSTGETGGSKFLREDGDGTCSWQAIGGGGDMLAANNLSDLASAATSRTNLGVDAAGTDNSTDVTLAGTGTYISIAGQVITVDPITESDISDLGTYSTDIHANITALDNVSGTNTGDQTSIVGITGTKAQFDTAVTDGNIMYVGDAPTSHTHTKSDITDFNEADYATGAEGDLASTALQSTDIDTLAELNAIVTDATLIDTTDARLSDARTPTAHTHVEADITDLQSYLLASDIANFETTTELNARDTNNRARANHTGTQLISTISDAGALASLNTVDTAQIDDDAVTIAKLSATGTASASTYLRGDNTWATVSGSGDLLASNNLSDVASAATSRTNLGLAIGTDVQAYSAVLQNTTASFLTADETKLDGIEAGAEVNDTVCISFAISDETTDLTTGTTKATFRMPFALTLTDVRASVSTAPTGSTLIVDINETATTILSTKLSIDAGEKTSATAASAVVISDTALADDAEITFDIDQVGSTVAGAGLKIYLIGNR